MVTFHSYVKLPEVTFPQTSSRTLNKCMSHVGHDCCLAGNTSAQCIIFLDADFGLHAHSGRNRTPNSAGRLTAFVVVNLGST